MNLNSLDLQPTTNPLGEPGCYLSQQQLRDLFRKYRAEHNFPYEFFEIMTGIDCNLLECWESGVIGINEKAAFLLFEVFNQIDEAEKRFKV